jgi:superoxide dismutase, Fe-Mn family
MKKQFYKIVLLITLFFLQSCNSKKFTEVVEVPLPAAEEKMTIGSPDDITADEGAFELQKLGYKYDALIPSIDAATMEIHYSKHYLGYTNNLNKALVGTEMIDLTIEEILEKADTNIPEVRNNAGGYYNHNIYWESMIPKGGGTPKDTLAASIDRDFGSLEDFTKQFKNAANAHFGSGWVWLISDKAGKLQIVSTNNQDNPLMIRASIKGTPLLAIDLWEHAYYLSYQNKRKRYIDAFFEVINWKKAQERYEEAIKK